jgi:biotin carboxyl carrier protein
MAKKEKPKLADIKYDDVPDYVTFVVHTAKYRTLPTYKFLNRKKWAPVVPGNVYANIPGTIRKIYTSVGKIVKKSDLLLELDAMKMYNKILSPVDGVVKVILVKEEQRVGKNELLIEIEVS